jgi:hypothetical protein
MNKLINNNSGYLMIFAMVFTAILLTSLAGLIGYAGVNLAAEKQTTKNQQALYLAEAGVERAIKMVNDNVNYAGETDVALGSGTFTVSVATIDQYTRRFTSTGKVPYGSGRLAEQTVAATAYIDTENVSFAYGVQVGNGGFTMDNNSIVNGNIYSNGNVSGSGSVTGDVIVAAGTAATPDQTWEEFNADFLFGHANSHKSVAQSFIPGQTDNLTKVNFYLKKVGIPGNLTVRIVDDNNGEPSKTVLATGSISASLVTGNYGFINATLDSNPALSAGQKYWLMLTAGSNSSNYYSWGTDVNSGYLNNTGMYSANWNAGNPIWNASNSDYNFQTFLGGIVTNLAGITTNGIAKATVMDSCTIDSDAYFDVSNSCTVGGQEFGGVQAPASVPFPISNAQIDGWKQVAAAGGVIVGDYTITDDQVNTLGPIKIDGDLEVSNNSVLYLTGPIWVNGDINLNNNVEVLVDAALGNNGTTIIADYELDTTTKGKVIISNNAILAGNGQTGSFPLLISTYSGEEEAIDLNNNADNAILFAPNGKLTISNNASVKEIIAKQIHMSNNSVVNYDSGLQSASFANGPGGTWTFQQGSYAIVP